MFQLRLEPRYQKLRQLIQGGELGRLMRLTWINTDWFRTDAYYASSDAELDVAAQHFASALSRGLLTVLELLIVHRVFRSVEGEIHKRFPAPTWLESQYEQAVSKRQQAGKSGSASGARSAESAETALQKTARRGREVVEVGASGARGEGMRQVGNGVPAAAIVLTGAVLVTGTIAVAAWAASSSSGRRAP